MTDNTANQVPLFTNMDQGSTENNILQYPFPIFQPQAAFMHPFTLMPNIWLPYNVDDLVLQQRMMELGPNVFPLSPSAIFGQMGSDTTKVAAPRKESVIVTAKPDGGVVPFTLTQELPTSCTAANLQSSFPTQEHQMDGIQSISAEDKSKSFNGEKQEEILSKKKLLSRSGPQKTCQKFTELDVAQILVNDIPVPFICQLKNDICQRTESTNEKAIPSDVPRNVLIREGDKKSSSDIAQETTLNKLESHPGIVFHSEKKTDNTRNMDVNEDDESCSILSSQATSSTINNVKENKEQMKQQDEKDVVTKKLHIDMKQKSKISFENNQASFFVWKRAVTSKQNNDLKSKQKEDDGSDKSLHNKVYCRDGLGNELPITNEVDKECTSSPPKTDVNVNDVCTNSRFNHKTSSCVVSEKHAPVTESSDIDQQATDMTEIESMDNNDSSETTSTEEEMEENVDRTLDECQELSCTSKMAYKCEVCCQLFRSPLGLQKHLEFHTDKVQHHTCSTCFEKFDNIASLEEHGKTHLKKRPHKCSFCPKAFRDPGSLQKHVRVHTGEKPYKCTSCFRSFAEYSSLRKHLRVHTGMIFVVHPSIQVGKWEN